MKVRKWVPVVVCLGVVLAASFAVGKDTTKKPKSGPLTGTWNCTAHGATQGDIPFTLYLEQDKDQVTGSVSSPMGGTQISAGTLKKYDLEIHFDTPQGNYQLSGHLKKGELSGRWSSDSDSGMWEGKKAESENK
jgi:hypothetical protein